MSTQIRFNGTSPVFHFIDSHPRFDWWSIIQESGHLVKHKGQSLEDGYISQVIVPEEYENTIRSQTVLQSLDILCAFL
jgi:hypothetical protein